MKLILFFNLCFFSLSSFSAVSITPLPKNLTYGQSERKYEITEAAATYLNSLAVQKKLQFYPKTKSFLFDGLLTNAEFSKAIVVSANRRVEPEYLNKIYQLKSGQLFHVTVQGQQLAVFLYKYSDVEAQEIYQKIKSELHSRHRFSFLLNTAEASEVGYSGGTSTSTNSSSSCATCAVSSSSDKKAEDPQSLGYVLGESFVGCGKGVIEGANSLARYPWDAAWEAGVGLKSLYKSPSAFWEKSKEQFSELADKITNFRKHLGDQWQSFARKTPKEKNEVWCSYVGSAGAGGAVSKAVRISKFLTTPKGAVTPEAIEASKKLAKIDAEVESNFFAVERGPKEIAMMKNDEILSALNKSGVTKSTNPKRVAALDKSQMQDLYRKVEHNPVADLCNYSKYDPGNKGTGFCFGRATAAHIEALKSGVQKESVRKVWAVGNFENGAGTWRYHVSTIVKGSDGQWYAVDPIMGKPIPVEQWYAQMQKMDTQGNMRLFTSEASRFGPGSSQRYTKESMNYEGYNNYFEDLMENFKKESRAVVEANKKAAGK